MKVQFTEPDGKIIPYGLAFDNIKDEK